MLQVTSIEQQTTGECCVCGDSDGLRMRCGHYICESDVLKNARYQIKSRSHKITCAQCTKVIDLNQLIKDGIVSGFFLYYKTGD